MCYVCRNEIGKEGYSHFCQHFREQRGRCRECDRCDLYAVEDEEAVTRRAAERAEREWSEAEGAKASGTPGAGAGDLDAWGRKLGLVKEEVLSGMRQEDWWSFDGVLDVLLEALLA